MLNKDLLISVIVPLYNCEKYIAQTILSVLNQTYINWELIIVDDGSTDKSFSIANLYISEKVVVYKQKNKGACAARNYGLKLSQGKYVKFLDADDILMHNCLEMQLKQISEMDFKQIPFGDFNFIDDLGNLLKKYDFHIEKELKEDPVKFFFSHWEVLISSPLHRKEHILEIGGFDEKLPRGQESDLHLRLALSGVQFNYRPLITFSYRSHSSESRISKNNSIQQQEIYMFYRMNKVEGLIQQYQIKSQYFNRVFFKYKFNYARRLFGAGDLCKGKELMLDAYKYNKRTIAFYIYFYMGKFLGYRKMENIVQFITRIRSKNTVNKKAESLAKYI